MMNHECCIFVDRECISCGKDFTSSKKKPHKISQTEAAWLAAALDGEGTISLVNTRTNRKSPFIGCYNMDKRFCDKVKLIIQAGGVNQKTDSGMWAFQTRARVKIKTILEQIIPYLIVKKANAIEILQWMEENPPKGKGNWGNSKAHREAALKGAKSSEKNHLKGNRVEGFHSKAGSNRWEKQRKKQNRFTTEQ